MCAPFSKLSQRLSAISTTDDQGHTLVYDAWNRLVGVYDGSTFIVGFTYDGMGRRTQEVTLDAYGNPITRDLYYSTSWQILDETVTTTGGGGTTLKDVRNVWSPVYVNALLLRDRSSSSDGDLSEERLYFTSDANYDVTSVISTAGSVTPAYNQTYNAAGWVTCVTTEGAPATTTLTSSMPLPAPQFHSQTRTPPPLRTTVNPRASF